jgi:hypothetical protein
MLGRRLLQRRFHQSISAWQHGHFSKLRVQGRNLLSISVRRIRGAAEGALHQNRYRRLRSNGGGDARALLKTSRPYVKTEIYKHSSTEERSAYFDDLRALGYLCFKCGDVELQGEPLRRHSDLSKWRHFDVFAVPEEFGAAR